MRVYESPEEHQPMMWVGGYALYAVHVIVAVFCLSMVVTSVMMFAHAGGALATLPFDSQRVLKGEVWRVITYGLFNEPSIRFAIDMVMMVWFGREVEKFFGRHVFLWLFSGIYLLPPLLFTLIGLQSHVVLAGESGALAIFVAFAALYPNVTIMFNIFAKWAAVILVGIYMLMAFADRNMPGLLSLCATIGFALGFVRYQQGRLSLPRIRLWEKKPKLRALPDQKPVKAERIQSSGGKNLAIKTAPESTMVEIDALLDKIAKSGLSSLTAKERARLDSARNDLRRKRPDSS